MDFPAVHGAAVVAVTRARAGEGPSLIEARTYRYMPNTSNDDDTRYRSREEVETWRKRDPLGRVRGLLLESGELTEEVATALEHAVAEEVAQAAAWAEAPPTPLPQAPLLHTYAAR